MNDTEPLVEPDAEAALAEIYRIKAEVAELEARRVELQDELAKHRLHGEQMLFLDDEGNAAGGPFGIERGQTGMAVGKVFQPRVHGPHQHPVAQLGETQIQRRQQVGIGRLWLHSPT